MQGVGSVTLLLIVLVIITISYFMVNIYRHDNSTFYKLTSYSYLEMLTSKKTRTLYKLVGVLDQVNSTHKILVNVQIPVNDTLKTIDALFLHESGIYVINVRAKSGWINGRESDYEWKELLHKGKNRTFNNPIYETKRLMLALRDQLAEVDEHAFQSIVLFTDDCSFQQIEIQSDNVEVLKMKNLKKWASSIKGNVISETDIQTLFVTLEGSMSKKNTILKAVSV